MANEPLGEVSVVVAANLDQLTADFARGKRAADQFDKALKDGPTAAANKFERATESAAAAINRQTDRMRQSTAESKRHTDALRAQTANEKALAASLERISNSYNKAAVAAVRYERELDDINRLEKAGILNAAAANNYRVLAGKAYRDGAAGLDKMNKSQRESLTIGRAFGAVLGVGVAMSLFQMAQSSLESTKAIGELSKQLHISTADLQVYQFGARELGIENSALEQGFTQLHEVIAKASTGSVKDAKVLGLVGISLKEIKAGTVDVNTALPRIADTLTKIHNPAQRAAVLMKLFGDEAGPKLEALLINGSAGIDALRDAAKRLGVVLSDRDIQEADRTAQKLDDVKRVLEANISREVAANATAIIGLATALGKLTGAVITFLSSNPELVGAAIGAIGGARIGGIPGALVGGGLGYGQGANVRQSADDSNSDIKFRRDAFRKARADRNRLKGMSDAAIVLESGETNPFLMATRAKAIRANANQNFIKQNGLLRGVLSGQGGTAASAGGATDPRLQSQLDALNAPAGKKTPKDHTAERIAEANRKYLDDLSQANREYLDAQADLTESVEAKYRAEMADIADDRESYTRKAQAEKYLSQSQKDELVAAHEKVLQTREAVAEQTRNFERARETAELEKQQGEAKMDALQLQLDLADTLKEQRDIERRMLEARKDAERRALQAIIDTNPTGSLEADLANKKMGGLDAKYDGEKAKGQRQDRDRLTGLNADLGNGFDTNDRLKAIQKEEDDRLEIIRAAREELLLTEQEYADREIAIHADAEAKKREAQTATDSMRLQSASETANSLADIAAGLVGKHSAAYRALFAISKGFAIADAAIKLQSAIASAAALPFPANIPAIAQAVALGASIVSNIAAVTANFDVGGWTGDGPAHAAAGTVHGQEFVVKAGPARRNRPALEMINRGADPVAAMAATGGLPGGRGGITVKMINQAPGVEHVAQQGTTPDEVIVIARRIVRQDSPKAVAGELERPNSLMRKTLERTTSARGKKS